MATSRFIRFFSRRQTKTQATILNDDNNNHHSKSKFLFNARTHLIEKPQSIIPIKNGLVCTVVFLDGEDVNFEVDRKALGKSLYDKVIAHTKLVESDYFGLQFIDTHNVKQWLDSTKSIKKQCKIGPPYTFRFRVKFYTSDPINLHDELTRYLFVLQLKDDIHTGKLDCPSGTDVELAALSMQAELGDYTSDEHSIKTISQFHFLPDDKQNEEFERAVLQKWTTYKGLTPADCEIQFLNKARWLEMYGVDVHTVMGKDGLEYKLGLTPTGILVFENKVKIGLFIWSKVTRIDFNRNKLTIVVVEDDDNDPRLQRDFVFLFRCHDEKQCKHFWKCALEYHIFFRTTSANKLKLNSKSNFTRNGSRFRFSGRTECQTTVLTTLTSRNINFERKASHRFSRHASYAIRKKIQEQEILREQEDERLRKLKFQQEAKLDENKKLLELKSQTNSFTFNHDVTSTCKRSSSQKNLNLSATQRLENLIQDSSNDLLLKETELNTNSTNLPSAPPIPPRQIKSDDKTTTTPLVFIKQSNSVNSCSINNINNVNTTKDLSNEFKSNNDHIDNDQTLLIQRFPQKISTSLTSGSHQSNSLRIDKMNSASNRYTLANSQSIPYVVKEQTSSDNLKLNKTNSSSYNKISLLNKFPLFALPISELTSYDNNRALYDNILNYCLNPLNESNSIYAKFDFHHRSLNLSSQEEQFERRCANYDNLSYLFIDGISSKKTLYRGKRNIASCKDYYAATNRFTFHEDEQHISIGSLAPVIVTRTLSQSSVRHASSTIVQATHSTLPSTQFNHRSSSSLMAFPSNHSQSYHPLTTEL
ncbi:unnamed protein product [Rotaria sp. Silwood1]|nr:unnamed protein product [Rotaria sp. Silwood1]CAF0993016.1 unnamed protein product [Rotaria sp. Silwood1]CAF4523789.1 unnamed protein product [Rotaria sp. Silwood1]CAF4532422.1 unnamed protein product [Rotaria sp. Silwood1]